MATEKENTVQVAHIEGDKEHTLSHAAALELHESRSTWQVVKANPRICIIIAVVQLNAIVVGIEQNMGSNLMGVDAFLKVMGTWDDAEQEYVVEGYRWVIWTIAQLSGFPALLLQSYLSDLFGRRFVLFLTIVLTMVGATLEATAPDWKLFAVAKVAMGAATSFMQSGVTTYIGEIAPREMRGVSLSAFNLLANLGNLISTLILYAAVQRWPSIDDERSWRIPLYIMIALPVIILAGEIVFAPESPYWYELKNKHDKARKSLRFMYPRHNDVALETELAKIAYTIEKEVSQDRISEQSSFRECFQGTDLRRTFCATFPTFSQPFSGHLLVGPMATLFFTLSGESNSLYCAAIVQSSCFACNLLLSFIIDNPRVGRKLILWIGVAILTSSMWVIGIIGAILPLPRDSPIASHALIAFVTIGACGSVCGPGAVGWVYAAESASARLRAKTASIGIFSNTAGILIWASTFTYIQNAMGLKCGFMFGSFGLLSLLVIYLFIPDYTGRSYAQLDEMFINRVATHSFRKYVCSGDYGYELNSERRVADGEQEDQL